MEEPTLSRAGKVTYDLTLSWLEIRARVAVCQRKQAMDVGKAGQQIP
jgi:hypothetical protein